MNVGIFEKTDYTQTYVDYVQKVAANYADIQRVLTDPTRGGIAACIQSDPGFRSYSSGVYNLGQGCNMAVVVSGFGFYGAVEGLPITSDVCDQKIGCTLAPNTLRVNPSLGTKWGENGYGTINAYVTTATAA
jgi:hypothetical protein